MCSMSIKSMGSVLVEPSIKIENVKKSFKSECKKQS